MAIPACRSRRAPRRRRHDGVRAAERAADDYCTVLWRVRKAFHNTGPSAVLTPFPPPNSQPFWGQMVAAAGAGPVPIPHRLLDSTNLAEAIRYCLTPQAAAAARGIAEKMRAESGVRRAVDSFHANLPLERMKCDIFPDKPACWRVKKKDGVCKLSKVAAEVLVSGGALDRGKLKMYVVHCV